MSVRARQRDREIIDRYTDQPTRLPAEVRAEIERAFEGRPVQLYALVDLDPALNLTESWLALGPERVGIARRRAGGHEGWTVEVIDRSRIRAVRETPGISCNVLHLQGAPDEPPLAVVRYTHRQLRAVELIRSVLAWEHADAESPATSVGLGPFQGDRVSTTGEDGAGPAPDGDDRYANAVAGPIREAQALVAGSDSAIIVRLLGYLRPYRRQVAIGMGAAAGVTLLSLVPAFLAGYLIDRVARPAQEGTLLPEAASRIALICVGAIAAAYLLRSLFTWIRLRFMSFLGEYVARDLRTEIYEHLQTLSLSFFSRKKTGSLITRVTSDTDRLWDFLAFGIVDVSLSGVMLVGIGAVLISLDWRLGLVMTLPVPLLTVFIFLHGKRLERYFLRAWRQWSRVTDVVSDTIPGIRVVKAFNQEDNERRRFGLRNQAATSQFNEIHSVWTKFWPTLMFGIHCLTVAVWFLALPRLLGNAAPGLSVGTFVSFLLYSTMFVGPIEVFGQMSRVMNRATSSAHRIFEVLDTEPEVVDRAAPVKIDLVAGRVTFESVSFGYEASRLVLRGMSFEVSAGEMIGLVGPSGGGKTTIANLIARFYDPLAGTVRIDGIDLRTIDTGSYRRQVGMVLQDPYLFHGTISENIRYGLPDADIGQVVAAARAANAHDFVCRLPHGYDTIVGERGHTLSGGERQRISIARALLHDPRILILDEATSSVDTDTERKIEEAMHRLIAGRTVFAIAHRLSTLRRASRLFVIEEGRLSESGTHGELMSNPQSTYRRLVELQREVQHAI
jgi:ATP-binding cassette, subfamily B, bacterial